MLKALTASCPTKASCIEKERPAQKSAGLFIDLSRQPFFRQARSNCHHSFFYKYSGGERSEGAAPPCRAKRGHRRRPAIFAVYRKNAADRRKAVPATNTTLKMKAGSPARRTPCCCATSHLPLGLASLRSAVPAARFAHISPLNLMGFTLPYQQPQRPKAQRGRCQEWSAGQVKRGRFRRKCPKQGGHHQW